MRARLLVLLVASLLVAPGAAQERGRGSEGAPQGQGRPAKPGGRGKAPERPAPATSGESAPAAGGQGAATTPPTGRSGAPQGRTGAPAPKAPAPPPVAAPVAVPPEQVTLAAAQALFHSSDLDGDRQLDLKEAAAAGLGPRDCNTADSDGDRMLAEAEFLAAYVTLLGRQQRRIAPDLQAAATAPVAPTTTPKVAAPASPARSASPVLAAPAPSRPGTAQYELENKIEEALRKNLGDQYVARPQPTPPVETSVPAAASSSPSEEVTESAPVERSLEQRAAELREALELRLRESGAGPEEVAAARARLERQLAELAQVASNKPAPGSRRDPTRTPDERDRELRENLEAKLLEDGATPEQAANARARLEARIAEMRAKDAERVAQEVGAEPAESRTFEQRAEELRANLELKLAETNASPAEAEAARARLERQLAELAQGSTPKPPPGSRRDLTRSPDERDRELRENLEAKLKEDKATPEQAANARERLEARIAEMRAKDAERGRASAVAPATAPTPAPEEPAQPASAPAPAEDPVEARFRNLREGLERKLAESGATPEEAAAERARLEKRIEALRREAAGGARPATGGKKKRDGGG
jgi:hypothetical protein